MFDVHCCLDDREVHQLLRGEQPDAAETFAKHLEQCERCAENVERLVSGDELLRTMQAQTTDDPARLPAVQTLIQRFLCLYPLPPSAAVDANARTAAILAAGTAEEPVPCDFLAAPQGPDEMGRLGPYRVLKVQGAGGMGIVFQAEDADLKRTVALKVMKPEVAARPAARERFLREARAAATLDHEHIVTIYHVGQERGVPFLAMQWLRGMNLEQRMQQGGPPSIPEVLRLGRQVAQGLAAAHAQGLIHRDVKPANLWLQNEPGATGARIKILDFGLARLVEDDAHLTASDAVVGTPVYLAPEQAEGGKLDHRCDLFGLGVVLYRLCTGKLPFPGGNPLAVLNALASRQPQPIRERAPSVPRPLADLVMQLLEKAPADRPASAQEVVDRLAAIEQQLAPTSELAAKPRRSRWKGVAAAAAVLTALLLPVGFFFGGAVVRHATNKGELVVEVDDPGVEVKVTQNGVVVNDTNRKREFVLTAGDGEVEVYEKASGLKLATRKFTLTRGARKTVVVCLVDLPPTADRRAAEWVLSISGTVRVNDEGREIKAAADLPRESFRLTCVTLDGNKQVSDAGLANFKDCKNLTQLHLGVTKVSDAGLAYFKDCKSLTHIVLRGTKVSDAGLAHFKDCKNLTHLELGGTQVSDVGLAHFKDCKSLGGLELGGTQVSDVGLAHFKDCKNLTQLWLQNTQVSDAGLAYFKDCNSLTHIVLRGTKVSDAGLAHFKDCKNLTLLYLSRTQVSDVGLAHFKDCKSLGGLELGGTQVSDVGLAYFKDCKNLTYLDLVGTKVSDAGLAHFKDCKNLTKLYLNSTQASDAGLAHFKDCKNLTILSLSRTKMSDAGLAHFKDCKNLTRLELWGTKVSDAGLAHFKDCKNLTELYLGATQVSDVGLAHFKDCKNLTHLNLGATQVSDMGLAHFKDCKNLRSLGLNARQVSDAGLAYFKDCKNLTHLNLKKTKVTAAKIEELKKALPRCRIEWDGGVIEPRARLDADRKAAVWALSIGGTVRVNGEGREIKAAAGLPGLAAGLSLRAKRA